MPEYLAPYQAALNAQGWANIPDALTQSFESWCNENKLHTLMLTDVPMVVIYNGTAIGAMGQRVEGYRSWPVAKPRLWGVKLADTSK